MDIILWESVNEIMNPPKKSTHHNFLLYKTIINNYNALGEKNDKDEMGHKKCFS